jgi:hypothetical protein
LLDKDGRTEAEVHAAIDWCQSHKFWRSNIMSMPTLRHQYDRMRLQAEGENAPEQAKNDKFARAMARVTQQRLEIVQ